MSVRNPVRKALLDMRYPLLQRRQWGRWASLAPWLLAASLTFRLATSIPMAHTLFIDLHVYVLGGMALDRPGTLYAVSYADLLGEPLPFIYPPFAAMLFYPLHWLPFPVVGWLWEFAIVVALYGLVRITQRMVGGGDHRMAMLWTAAGIWFEPIRNSLDFDQVSVFITLAVLYAAYTQRSWLAGVLVGVAAGVKVTPAITGLYFAGMRRWAVVAVSAATFFATVGLSAVVAPTETRQFFAGLFSRIPMPTATALNQSWQGTISRIVGHNASHTVVIVAIGVTAVLAGWAWWALAGDALGSLLVVQLFGLTLSPISWTHHWVWVVPLTIWLIQGRDERGAHVLGWVWFALMMIGVPTLLSLQQTDPSVFSRPWYLAWGEAVYVPMTLLTFAWMISTRFRPRRSVSAGVRVPYRLSYRSDTVFPWGKHPITFVITTSTTSPTTRRSSLAG